MGLGKTRSAIACAVAYQEDWPVLVVCPSSAKHHWQAELISLLAPHTLKAKDVTVVENNKHPLGEEGRNSEYKFVIISYNLVASMSEKIKSMNFNVVICDECHYLKSPLAKRTKLLAPFVKECKRAIMLSGTPALSRPIELFTQLNMLDERTWSDEKEFGKRYCKAASKKKAGKFGAEFKGASNTHELHLLLVDSVMIRRLKKDILKQLPKKRREVIKVEVEDEFERVEMERMLEELKRLEDDAKERKRMRLNGNHVEPQDGDERQKKMNVMMALFNMSGMAKLPAILKHVEAFIANKLGGKLLIFAHHRAVLDGISKYLKEAGEEIIRIDGHTSGKERHRLVTHFQASADVRFAVLAITAAGISITLTAGVLFLIDHVLYFLIHSSTNNTSSLSSPFSKLPTCFSLKCFGPLAR